MTITYVDFDSGTCSSNLDSKIESIDYKLKTITNPYIGNKRKIISKIIRLTNDKSVKCDTVLDLFSGSGMVSLAFKLLDKNIIANDLMLSSFANAYVFLDEGNLLTEEDKKYLFNNININSKKLVENKYKDKFTINEYTFMDNYRANAEDFGFGTSKFYRSMVAILHYIMKNCFVGGRLNRGQIIAKLDHRLNHAKNSGNEMVFNINNLSWYDFSMNNEKKHTALNLDAFEAIKATKEKNIDLCYIDPPYGGSQSDYFFMYNFFESYIKNSTDKDIVFVENSKKFVNKKEYENNFCNLLKLLNDIPSLIISYNSSSWADIDSIVKHISKYRDNVSVDSISYDYNYRDKNLNKDSKEYIILAQ